MLQIPTTDYHDDTFLDLMSCGSHETIDAES